MQRLPNDEIPRGYLFAMLQEVNTIYKRFIVASLAYIVMASVIVIIEPVPVTMDSVYFVMMVFLGHVMCIAHAIYQGETNTYSKPSHEYYTCTAGTFYGLVSLGFALYLVGTCWKSSEMATKVLFACSVLVSGFWVLFWLRLLRKRHAIRAASDVDNISCLLLLRCACIPSESKKLLVVIPYLALGFLCLVEAIIHR
jgi:hypothetical protein